MSANIQLQQPLGVIQGFQNSKISKKNRKQRSSRGFKNYYSTEYIKFLNESLDRSINTLLNYAGVPA